MKLREGEGIGKGWGGGGGGGGERERERESENEREGEIIANPVNDRHSPFSTMPWPDHLLEITAC